MLKVRMLAALLLGMAVPLAATAATGTETLVMVRHGETAKGGLGQLSCKGLNRALALPKVLQTKFGKPGEIFAPNPTEKMHEGGGNYYYVRPLATIEPTAIYFDMPVQLPYGYSKVDAMRKELTQPDLDDSLVFVAWEHGELRAIAQKILAMYGTDPKVVPPWPSWKYDYIYVITIQRDGNKATASFKLEHEGLNNEPNQCPAPTPGKR